MRGGRAPDVEARAGGRHRLMTLAKPEVRADADAHAAEEAVREALRQRVDRRRVLAGVAEEGRRVQRERRSEVGVHRSELDGAVAALRHAVAERGDAREALRSDGAEGVFTLPLDPEVVGVYALEVTDARLDIPASELQHEMRMTVTTAIPQDL